MDRLTNIDRYGHFYTNKANCRNVWSKDGKKLEGEFFENQTLAIDGEAIVKLGQIEDLMEKYQIKDLEMLERMIIRHDNNCMLEEKIGCPLDVYYKLHNKAYIYNKDGNHLKVLQVLGDTVVVRTTLLEKLFIPLNEYKKKYWLKEDKSE